MNLDIYDFDKTIVPFDSGTKFTFYCMIHYPWCILYMPIIAIAWVLMSLKIIGFTAFKRIVFVYIMLVPTQRAVKGFWDKNEKFVHPWFKDRERYSVVISASPDFLLNEISKRLGFDELICTVHNKKTGAIIGENCKGDEKVRRFYELHNKEDVNVIDVYSDSIPHDRPIFSLATGQCYHIVNSEKIKFDLKDV